MEESIWYVLLNDPYSLEVPAKLIHNTDDEEVELMYADFIGKLMIHEHGPSWCFFFATDAEMGLVEA